MDAETDISKIRERITRLAQQHQELRSISSRLREANNQLAYLTATAFVVIDDGKTVQTYGVSTEVQHTRAGSLFLRLTKDARRVEVYDYISEGKFTIFLDFEGRANIEIEEDGHGGAQPYHLHAFPTRDRAIAYAEGRQSQMISR